MKKLIWVEMEVNVENMAEQLANELKPTDLLDFLTLVDAYVAEVSFTSELIERLQKSLDEELN